MKLVLFQNRFAPFSLSPYEQVAQSVFFCLFNDLNWQPVDL